ncbi:caspase family protein [Parasedimentitalea marina]|uniref:caspase family protein n=1 Tax=Parasedimentitalea marina TaxID=2483033 RepID=UPI001EE7B59C|nr:caspase family protein [Parasedimentitalea marina]
MPDHAIVIGIDRYPGISDLQGPCNDAQLFREWLINPAGGSLDPANVKMCLSSEFDPPDGLEDAHPLQSEIERLFRPLSTRAAHGEHIDGRLFLFVAGHGFADPQDMDSAALYAADATDEFHTHVAVELYASYFRRLWTFNEIFLIFDACRTNLPFQRISSPPLPELQAHANTNKVKMFYGYATGFGSAARERKFDGVAHGVFTKTMIAALESATPNRLGRVTGSIIKDRVHNIFGEVAGDLVVTAPTIKVDSDKEVLFLQREAAEAVGPETMFQIRDQYLGQTLIFESFGGVEVIRHTIVELKFGLRIEPEFYKVLILETEENDLIEVRGDAIIIELKFGDA